MLVDDAPVGNPFSREYMCMTVEYAKLLFSLAILAWGICMHELYYGRWYNLLRPANSYGGRVFGREVIF
jgi:hypothetical protein